jgi:hypothetical protein
MHGDKQYDVQPTITNHHQFFPLDDHVAAAPKPDHGRTNDQQPALAAIVDRSIDRLCPLHRLIDKASLSLSAAASEP